MENIYIVEEGTVTLASELTAEQARHLTTRELEYSWLAVRTTTPEKALRFAEIHSKAVEMGSTGPISRKHDTIVNAKCRMPDTMTVTAMLTHPTYARTIVHNWNR